MIYQILSIELNTQLDLKKNLKKSLKQGKSEEEFLNVLLKLANGKKLEKKYKPHKLNSNKNFENCYECHITPDWLLVYKYNN